MEEDFNHDAMQGIAHEGHEGFGEAESFFPTDDPTRQIVNAALKVYRTLGPGLLEDVYEGCLALELKKAGFQMECQKILPVFYDGLKIDLGYRLDMIVDGKYIIEVKEVEKLISLYDAQILTYLKLSGLSVGFLMNFNASPFKQGLKRFKL